MGSGGSRREGPRRALTKAWGARAGGLLGRPEPTVKVGTLEELESSGTERQGLLLMVKYSSIVALGLVALACGSSPDDGDGTLGSGSIAGTSSGGASAGAPSFGGNTLSFGGSMSSVAGMTSGEVGSGTVEELRKASCAGWSAEPEALPAVIEMVVDVSGSMDDKTPATKGRTKWAVTREALSSAVDSLPASTGVGVLYYPNRRTSASSTARDVSSCVNVDAMLGTALLGSSGSAHRTAIAQSLQSTRANGSTPTHDAYKYALVNGLEASKLAGNRFMLLITDGAPTLAAQCIGTGRTENPSPTQPIIDEVKAARARGIRTFIIGSPGSEISVDGGDARPWMSRAATEGGTAQPGCSDQGPNFCHIDLTQAEDFGAALNSALAAVAGQVVSCNYQLPEPPTGQTLDLDKINVILTPGGGTPELVGRTTDSACTEGYRVDTNNEVVLCSETCAKVQADSASSIEVLFGCTSEPVKVK